MLLLNFLWGQLCIGCIRQGLLPPPPIPGEGGQCFRLSCSVWTIGSRCHTHESTHVIPRYVRADAAGVEIDVGDSQVDELADPQRVPEGHEHRDVIADPVARERLGGLEEAVNLFGEKVIVGDL